jgi:hypothetical protein
MLIKLLKIDKEILKEVLFYGGFISKSGADEKTRTSTP